jgi:Na+-transporting NADH:ubiquinone oxidoreductase subunit NqrC
MTLKFMGMLLRPFRRHPSAWKLLVVVCLLCVTTVLTAAVVHLHPAQESAQHCAICSVAHLSAAPTHYEPIATPGGASVEFLVLQFDKAPPVALLTFSLCIRPPPAR